MASVENLVNFVNGAFVGALKWVPGSSQTVTLPPTAPPSALATLRSTSSSGVTEWTTESAPQRLILGTRTAQTLTAGSTIAVSSSVAVPINSASNITLSSSPQIAAGADRQIVTLVNVGSFSITIGSASGNLLDQAVVLAPNRTLTLMYLSSVSAWVAVAPNLLNLALSGVPTAPTAAVGTATTQIATTAFVVANTSLIVRGTAVVFAPVSSIDFTIPTTANRITLMISGAATAVGMLVQLGSGTPQTTGYFSASAFFGTSTGARTASTTGLLTADTATANSSSVSTLVRVDGNTWAMTSTSLYQTDYIVQCAGVANISGVVNILRLKPPSGLFNSGGTVNILVE